MNTSDNLKKASLSTHVLDTSQGRPAAGISLTLEVLEKKDQWKWVAQSTTNTDGRAPNLLTPHLHLSAGIYRLTFETAAYFRAQGVACFYPYVAVVFEKTNDLAHYHVPLLLSPYGYSTYRGS